MRVKQAGAEAGAGLISASRAVSERQQVTPKCSLSDKTQADLGCLLDYMEKVVLYLEIPENN